MVGCPTLKECAIIDPQGDPEEYVRRASKRGLTITAIIDTHLHADHRSCARALRAQTGAPLYLGRDADVEYEYSPVEEGSVLSVGNRQMHIFHTPGHTPEHISVYVDNWIVLTGDTLFVGDVGRIDLSAHKSSKPVSIEKSAQELYHSLQRLMALPEWTEVYPGHYAGSVCGRGIDCKPMSTIGRERQKNKALQLSEVEFVKFQSENVPPLPEEFREIVEFNAGRAV